MVCNKCNKTEASNKRVGKLKKSSSKAECTKDSYSYLPSSFIASFLMITLAIGFVGIFLMYSCTISVITTDTHGKADDVVDTEQVAEPNISPNLSVPLK